MAGKKSVIETGVDKLVALVSRAKKISVKDAAKELGVSVASIEEWADFLEDEGIISIHSKFATVYLVEKKIGAKELTEKVKAVKGEKEDFLRRVESSINALERDHEEIKLIDSEFRKIRGVLQENFNQLSSKLEKLEDFRKSHSVIESKRRDIEKEYDKRLVELENQLAKDHKDYESIISSIEQEMAKIGKERQNIDQMKGAEKELEGKVGEINRMIETVQKNIDKSNEQLEIDEKRLAKSEASAAAIKEHIEKSSKELDVVTKEVKESHKALREMETGFIKDLESLQRGDLNKIGPYKESKQLVEKLKTFFEQTKDLDDMILKAETEEEKLKEEFNKLIKKAQAFSVMTGSSEVKKELSAIREELVEIEKRKGVLGTQLKKLRNLMRSLSK